MWARIALAAALGFGCDGGGSEPDASDASAIVNGASMGDAGAGGPCHAFEGPTELGRIDDPGLTELSGLAASRRHPGLFYAHNDSGDVARVYVLDASGSVVGRIALTGAAHVDYEDIAVGPSPDGEPWVHVGDVGDNAARDGRGTPRDAIAVYRGTDVYELTESARQLGQHIRRHQGQRAVSGAQSLALRGLERAREVGAVACRASSPVVFTLNVVAAAGAPQPRMMVATAPTTAPRTLRPARAPRVVSRMLPPLTRVPAQT